MKKTKLLIPLVAAALSVLSGCGGNGGGKSSKKDPNCVDKLLGKLIENSGITYDIPKMPDSNSWDAKLIYSENAECYIVEASCSDSRGTKEKDLKKAFDESEWNCVNDSENTYEDYGYCYGDAKKQKDCKFEIDFCSFDGDFYLYAYDWGNTYTGSELDSDLNPLAWYWQYEQEGLEYTDTWFSKDFVNESLGVSLSSFPSITLEKGMLAGAFEAIDDEYGSQPAYIAATILDDSTSKLLDAFKGDGWVVEEIEDYYYDQYYDEYPYTDYLIKDIEKDILVEWYSYGGDVTYFSITIFSDLYVVERTSNTTWTEDESEIFMDYLGEDIPFMQFGSDYYVSDEYYSWFECLIISDTYYLSLESEYISILEDNGYVLVEDEEDYYYGNYALTVGEDRIVIEYSYDGGNFVCVYFD